MNESDAFSTFHRHVFLGEGHEKSERRTWAVIWLCGAMMIAEIVGGLLFGSIALVADGLHMSTHAGALLLAALAYTYARKHADDPHFTFGTGKLGDLAGFTSAIILAMIALLIGYESVSRIFAPVAIHFREAIPIACLGLAVNIASAWLLSGGGHHHGHGHGHAHEGHDHDEAHHIATEPGGVVARSVRGRRSAALPAAVGTRAEILEARAVKLKPCGRMALGSGSRWWIATATWSPSRKFQNRTRSRRICASAAKVTPSTLKSTNTRTDRDAPRQQHARRRHPRHRRRRGVGARHRRPAARPRFWLALDGPARGHRRRLSSSQAGPTA